MFPNFAFQDAPFNLKYYKPGIPQTEIAYMGCRTRVIGNVYDSEQEISYSRGNLSFTTINLPRLAIMSRDIVEFRKRLDETLELVAEQLLERFSIQSSKKVYNFPFLMGQGVWLDADMLNTDDTVGDVIKHGTLSIGFIGLAEMLTRLFGKHHGEDTMSQRAGLEIIGYMREFCNKKSAETGLNFTLLATPAEGLSGRFVKLDAERFGLIEGVTDKEYYTNSFHIPVGYAISMFDKISLEAPYHELTNAGHISYVEVDGNLADNLEAFETIVKYMGECGIGYGAVNHPLDRDPVCGYSGIIKDECPQCGRKDTDGIPFERIRRITGYLVGSVERFNNAKRAEERDRIKHK
jgi:ribonucleoside-triphosphate reductase